MNGFFVERTLGATEVGWKPLEPGFAVAVCPEMVAMVRSEDHDGILF